MSKQFNTLAEAAPTSVDPTLTLHDAFHAERSPQSWNGYSGFARCSCGWVGQDTVDPHKSWRGHYRRVTSQC